MAVWTVETVARTVQVAAWTVPAAARTVRFPLPTVRIALRIVRIAARTVRKGASCNNSSRDMGSFCCIIRVQWPMKRRYDTDSSFSLPTLMRGPVA